MKVNKIKFNEWHCHLKNPCGFTLVEMVIAIALMGVIGIFSTQFITSITQSAQQTTTQKGLVDDAKLAMEYLIREVRVATEEFTEVDFNSSATAADITFDKFSGYTEDTNTVGIVYNWISASQTLTRTSGGTTTTLATQITSFTIVEVVDSNFYEFTMTLQGPNGENFTLESGVRPRSTTS